MVRTSTVKLVAHTVNAVGLETTANIFKVKSVLIKSDIFIIVLVKETMKVTMCPAH